MNRETVLLTWWQGKEEVGISQALELKDVHPTQDAFHWVFLEVIDRND